MTTTPPRPGRPELEGAEGAEGSTASVPEGDHADPAPALGGDPAAPPYWQRIGERRRPSRIALTYFLPILAAVVVGQVAGRIAVRGVGDPDWPGLAAAGGTMLGWVVVGWAVVALVLRMAYRPAAVDLRRGLLRSGRRTVPLTTVTWAKVVVRDESSRSPAALLTFGAEGGPRVAVLVRDADGTVLPDDQRAVVASALSRTAIRVPRSSADPTGRFARYNFPGRVTKEDAIALVEHPTERDDLLPESAASVLETARTRATERAARRGASRGR